MILTHPTILMAPEFQRGGLLDTMPTTSSPSATSRPYWEYTSTDLYEKIIACEDTSLSDYGGFAETSCAGTSLTLYAPLSASVPIATSTHVNVGTLTSNVLYTSISNALETLCPTPTANEMPSCNSQTAAVEDIVHWIGLAGQDALEV